jgi:hypothetical protein
MTFEEWGPIMAYLGASCGKPMPDPQGEVYFDLLADLPAEAVRAAAKAAVAGSTYPVIPPVGVIRSHAVAAIHGEADDWGEAWRQVLDAVRYHGLDRREKGLASLPGPAARAADQIGWRSLCDAVELDTIRAQFRDVYQQVRGRVEREKGLPPGVKAALAGLTEGMGRLPE